jgi:hypothetical protein
MAKFVVHSLFDVMVGGYAYEKSEELYYVREYGRLLQQFFFLCAYLASFFRREVLNQLLQSARTAAAGRSPVTIGGQWSLVGHSALHRQKNINKIN